MKSGSSPRAISIVDSHTGGEPTRLVIQGGPELGDGNTAAKLDVFRRHHDQFRSAIVNEPRGSEALVGALLVPPADKTCVSGVIFFNNVGFLGMCGHGVIGVLATLAHLRRIEPGRHRLETPVGVVPAVLHDDGRVSFENIPSYRQAKGVSVLVDGLPQARVTGDVAWGGNWFFLTENHGLDLDLGACQKLMEYARRVRQAVNRQGYPEVDHIELCGPPKDPNAHGRNFVLCPGLTYDRSPCGTGTSARIACLAAEGRLREGEIWIQEGILGSSFAASYQKRGDHIIPTITGQAFVTGEATLFLDPNDPFCWGIR